LAKKRGKALPWGWEVDWEKSGGDVNELGGANGRLS